MSKVSEQHPWWILKQLSYSHTYSEHTLSFPLSSSADSSPNSPKAQTCESRISWTLNKKDRQDPSILLGHWNNILFIGPKTPNEFWHMQATQWCLLTQIFSRTAVNYWRSSFAVYLFADVIAHTWAWFSRKRGTWAWKFQTTGGFFCQLVLLWLQNLVVHVTPLGLRLCLQCCTHDSLGGYYKLQDN